MSWFWGESKKRPSYGIRAEKHADDYLKKLFKVVSMGRTLKRAPASHGPADWEVVDSAGKIIALIQIKSSIYKGKARLSTKERDKLIEEAKRYHTRAFLTIYERGHYHTKQLYPIRLMKNSQRTLTSEALLFQSKRASKIIWLLAKLPLIRARPFAISLTRAS